VRLASDIDGQLSAEMKVHFLAPTRCSCLTSDVIANEGGTVGSASQWISVVAATNCARSIDQQ
jgi:hypothetical protein